MNYQKLALKKLIEDKDFNLFIKLNKNMFTKTNKTIFSMIEKYYNKYEKLPDKDVLKAASTKSFNKEKAEVVNAVIDSLDKIKENLTNEELLKELKEETVIRALDEFSEDFIDAIQNREIDKIKELNNLIDNHLSSVDDKLPIKIDNIEFSIKGLASYDIFLKTLRDNGVRLSGVIVIQAKTNAGKSIFSLQQAIYSYEQGLNVAFLSLEMPISQLFLRMYSMVNNINYSDLLKIEKEELIRIVEEWKKEYFNRDNLFFVNDIRYNDIDLLKTVRQLIKNGVQIIVIDYLNLIESSNPNQPDYKIMSDLVKNLHDIALEHGIVFVSPVQINIEESKKGNVTAVSRTSKEIDFTASLSILLYQNEEERKENVVRVIVNKNRNGAKPTIMCKADFQHMKFIDLGIVL